MSDRMSQRMKSTLLIAGIAGLIGIGSESYVSSEPQREKDPARDAERILAAEQKRARKAARRAARNKV
jgi:hypothetical protein